MVNDGAAAGMDWPPAPVMVNCGTLTVVVPFATAWKTIMRTAPVPETPPEAGTRAMPTAASPLSFGYCVKEPDPARSA